MISCLKEGFADFGLWIHTNAEDITAISVCLITMQNIEIVNEIFKGLFSIITALLSSYIVHELKTNNYNLIKMFKSIHKKLKKTKIKKRK